MTSPLKISMVTPNYNGVEFLQQTLDSVLSQHYPALQYVVADGASRDGSVITIESYRHLLSDVISEPDKGHADALNKGFALCDGEVMGWINSDDTLHPHSLWVVDRIFRTFPHVEWITGRPTCMDVQGQVNYIGPVRPWSRLRFLAGDHAFIQQESTFWRRSLWEKAGGTLDLDFRVANDFDLWARFFRHANLYSVDFMLGCFRVRPGQRSVEERAEYEAEMRAIVQRELDQAPKTFRTVFPNLVPKTACTLTTAERVQLDPQIGVQDPPVISRFELSTKKLGPGGTRYGSGLTSPEPVSDLTPFRNRHAGQRCFILGNGPSLNQTDLSLLKNEIVFGCNSVFLLFDRIDWRPAYYACVDSRVLPDRADDINAMLDANPQMTGFFPAEILEHGGTRQRSASRTKISEGENRFFFNEVTGSVENLPWSMFSIDINHHVVQPHTVAITMLQLAQYMGFSEMYLLGCDMRYTVPEDVRREDDGDPADSRLTSETDTDPNHFDPTYFGAGRQWHVPNVELMREHFAQARQALEAQGVTVRNATVGGDLEEFERVELSTLFPAPKQPRPRQAAKQIGVPSPAIGLEQPRSEWPKRLGGLWTSVKLNAGFLIAASACLALLIIAGALVPEARVWLAIGGVGALCLAVIGAIAIKTRRLFYTMTDQLQEVQRGRASSELTIQRLELALDAMQREAESRADADETR